MTADVIAGLRSPEGEAWSRSRTAYQPTSTPPHYYQWGPGDPGEDPTGRPPLTPEEAAAMGGEAA